MDKQLLDNSGHLSPEECNLMLLCTNSYSPHPPLRVRSSFKMTTHLYTLGHVRKCVNMNLHFKYLPIYLDD